MRLNKEEYYLTSLHTEILETIFRLERILTQVKAKDANTIQWKLLEYLFDRYHRLQSIKLEFLTKETLVYNTTLDYFLEKEGNANNKPTCSVSNIKSIINQHSI